MDRDWDLVWFWLIWWVLGFDLGWGCGWWVRWLRWVGLKLWVMVSMDWFRWFGLRLWVAAGSWITVEIGFWFGLRLRVELRWLDFGERWVNDCVVLVVVVESWKRKVGGGYIVGFFFFLVVGGCKLRSGGRVRLLGPRLCFFFPWCRGLWLWLVGQQWRWWRWLLLLCSDGLVFVVIVYHYFNELFILF